MLKKYIGVKGIEAKLRKRNLSSYIVNTIGGKYLSIIKIIYYMRTLDK